MIASNDGRWSMPAEERAHAATWMCWPSSTGIWGGSLAGVQDTIIALARIIARFEPVKMLARPNELARLHRLLSEAVEVIEAPVDDLWARDTLPLFIRANNPQDTVPLAAARLRFNGWGNKQRHSGDAQLAELVASRLGIPLLDADLTGEGGGVETDGAGTLLAARSSWVNPNRNPDLDEAEIGARLVALLGAKRIIWIDGIAGEDITDGHIDTLARFVHPGALIVDRPDYVEPGEVWYDVAEATKRSLTEVQQAQGGPLSLIPLVQPTNPRGKGQDFLSSYVNYYVCNGAVIAPSFGDSAADRAAADVLREQYPGREVVQLDIDPLAAGGGGIHCATQQQPTSG